MKNRPNILFLFSDQHNAGVLGCENHPDVLTPNLDQLAAKGTRFSRAYCQDGVCAPSRCSLFSGLYPRSLGCMGNSDRNQAMREVVSLPSAFQANGYTTAAFGKRHLHLGCDEGWEIKASHLVKESPDDNYVRWIYEQGFGGAFARDWSSEWGRGPEGTPAEKQEMPFVLMCSQESRLPDGMTMEGWTKNRTVDFVRSRKNAEEPFFCFSSFYRPHQPYTPLPRYYSRFNRTRWGEGRRKRDGIAMPPSLREPAEALPPRFQFVHSGGNRVFRVDLARQDEQLYRNYVAAYYALVEEIDDHVGDILRALDETGQRENTIIIYASDHGDFVGAHGMIEKCASGHNVYEDTLRVPLIFNWPGTIQSGLNCDGLAELVDLYPTMMDLCGIKPPALKHSLQGRSLAGALLRGEPTGRAFAISENWGQSTIITDQHKLGIWQQPRNPKWKDFRAFGDMLFDRAKDPLEIRNVAGTPDYGEVEKELGNQFHAWKQSMEGRTAPFDAGATEAVGA